MLSTSAMIVWYPFAPTGCGWGRTFSAIWCRRLVSVALKTSWHLPCLGGHQR